jgi:hypothetical protein
LQGVIPWCQGEEQGVSGCRCGQAESQVAPPGATAKAAGAVGADPLWHPELPEDRQLAGGHFVMPEGTDKVVSARQDKSSKPRPQARQHRDTTARHRVTVPALPCIAAPASSVAHGLKGQGACVLPCAPAI